MPPLWSQKNVLIHIVLVDNTVDLEKDCELIAPFVDVLQLIQMLAFATADVHIGFLNKGVAGNGQDVKVLSILLHPLPFDHASVGHDAHWLQVELLFAVPDQVSQSFCTEEGFPTTEVQFLHACVTQACQALLGFLEAFWCAG